MGIARNSDGWITYPRGLQLQAEMVARWQAAVTAYAPGVFKPFVQSLYIEMAEHPDHSPSPIHLILRAGCNVILQFLEGLSAAGVNHVVLNFKYGERDAAQVVEEVGREILPRLEYSEAGRMGAI